MESPLSNSPLNPNQSFQRPYGRRPSPPFFFGIAAASAAVKPKKGKSMGCGFVVCTEKEKDGGEVRTIFNVMDQSHVGVVSHSLKTLGRFGLGWVNICSSAAVIVEFLLRGQPGSTGADCRSWDCCNSPSWIGSPVGHRRGRLDIIRWLH